MKIKLQNKNKHIFVDKEDYDLVKQFKWYLFKVDSKEYATTSARIISGKITPLMSLKECAKKRRNLTTGSRFNNKKLYKNPIKTISLHRFIMNPKKDMEVDHINGNGLDNRRINLRICTRSQNGKNRQLSKSNTSGYHGVTFTRDCKRTKPWLVNIRANGKIKYIGRYKDKKEAAFAYNEAAKKYHGEFATLNKLC